MKWLLLPEGWISKLNVGKRLAVGFGVLLLFILSVGAVGIGGMHRLSENVNSIVLQNNAKLGYAQAMGNALNLHESGLLNLLLADTNEQRQEHLKGIKWQVSQYDDAKSGLAETLTQTKPMDFETSIVATIHEDEAAVPPLLAKVVQMSNDEKHEEALEALKKEVKPALKKWVVDLAELVSIEQKLNDAAAVEAERSYSLARAIAAACIASAIVLGALIAFWIARSITRPLKEAVSVAQRVAIGDLTSVIEVRTKDETGMLLQALKNMNESLLKIVGEVRSGIGAIGSGTKQIASGNADLSQRTEEQASALEETASSMEELTSTVKQNAENAKQANQLAIGASAVAVKGGAVVGQVVETMSSINESSKKIVDIIGVIDGIAFQTNILALNAAVEAARAGEQGRGFAVVATEVRNLAQRSAAAAKEIKALIGDSVDKVGAGTKLVDEAGKTMEEIVTSVKRVTDIMSEITAASQEQSSGIEQINQAITQMDDVTQQNAALVEEAAAAAESLEEQAQNLNAAVAVFKMTNAPTGMTAGRSMELLEKREQPVRPAAEVRRLTPRAKAKPQAPARTAVAHTKTGTDGDWKEF
jgi:methyl-accepting chemotaxis protein